MSMSTNTHNDTEDARRWRQIATLIREIDAATRGIQTSNASDDELLDAALQALRKFPKLVEERDEAKKEHARLLDDLNRLTAGVFMG